MSDKLLGVFTKQFSLTGQIIPSVNVCDILPSQLRFSLSKNA